MSSLTYIGNQHPQSHIARDSSHAIDDMFLAAERYGSSAVMLASMLSNACQTDGGSFAVAMHERLCERGDQEHADLWLEVVCLLRR
jgi:hypothetical protein